MRKRSKYKPKGVRVDVVNWVLSGLKPVAKHEEVLHLRTKNHSSMASILAGTGTRDDVDVLIAAMNMTESLSLIRNELGYDWKTEISTAQTALFTMAQRGLTRGRFLFTGPEMQAIKLAMEIHDAQIDQCTIQDFERALDLIAKTVREGNAKKITPLENA
jgi:hypothetical protein